MRTFANLPTWLPTIGRGGRAKPATLGTVAVRGPSMAPTLAHGDLLLVRWGAQVRSGDVVLGRFRSLPDQLVVKRVVEPSDGGWWVVGDNSAVADDSRRYGVADVEARVLLRYWPPPVRRARLRRR